MYLYNKNTLEYIEIVGSEPKSMILNIEGRSSIYIGCPLRFNFFFYILGWEVGLV